jgi:GDP-L-fucose synthase
VLPALIRKFHEAKISSASFVTLWGSGSPKREFLHVDDLANACFHLMQNYNEKQFLNIGTGEDLTIRELAELIKNVVGYTGDIIWDSTKPDGTPRKLMDVSKAHSLGWVHEISLEEGIKKTYTDFLTLI